MRIQTDGNYEWQKDVYQEVADLLDKGTKSGAIDSSVLFMKEMIPHLERAMDHPDMMPALVALLSTSQVELEYEIHSGDETEERPEDLPNNVPLKATITIKEINDNRYYYWQWRDGDKIHSQYKSPVNSDE